MYRIISFSFWFIRQFFIQNPFEVLGEGITINIGNSPILLTPDLLNWIVGFILPVFTYLIVGLFYEKNSNPEGGSALYMLFYLIHIAMLHLLSLAYPNFWIIAIIIATYVTINIITYRTTINSRL